jgi:flagellar biosynthesis/type III secretory pathway chaperone
MQPKTIQRQGRPRAKGHRVAKLERDAGITAAADEILITSGSLQELDLVNGLLLTRPTRRSQ